MPKSHKRVHRKKTRHNKKSSGSKKFFRKVKRVTKKAVPVVTQGLKTVGTVTKTAVVKGAPYVEKGVAGVYDTLATGFDMGIRGAKTIMQKRSMRRTRRR